jgi:hypothetical protein
VALGLRPARGAGGERLSEPTGAQTLRGRSKTVRDAGRRHCARWPGLRTQIWWTPLVDACRVGNLWLTLRCTAGFEAQI